MTTLTQLLTITGHPITATAWNERLNNACLQDIIDRFDDCWDGLLNFERSDWVNLCECYTSDLLKRWDRHSDCISTLWNDYCEAIGATSTIHALEGVCDGFEDGDDMNAAMVNIAMSHGASELLQWLARWADDHTDHEGPIWDELRKHA